MVNVGLSNPLLTAGASGYFIVLSDRNPLMNTQLKRIACLVLLAAATQGCLVNRIMDSQDRNHYSEYLSGVSKNNVEREKAGLQPEKPMTFDDWRGKK